MTNEASPLGSQPSTNSNRDVLLALYTSCRFDIRNFDIMIWQIPAASYVITGAVVAFILNTHVKGLGSIFASFFLIVLTAPLTLALIKNRFFQMSRMREANELIKKLSCITLNDYPTKTSDVKQMESSPTNCLLKLLRPLETKVWKRSAYNYLLCVMLFSHIVQLLLLVISIVNSLG